MTVQYLKRCERTDQESVGRMGSSYIMHSSRKAERSSIRCLTALPFSPVAFLHDARCQMAQSSLSMPAAPRRQRLGCCSPILQFWKHIQRLVAGSDDLWDEAEKIVEQKEEDTFSTDESASEFHLSEVTTICERGETKCSEVASL